MDGVNTVVGGPEVGAWRAAGGRPSGRTAGALHAPRVPSRRDTWRKAWSTSATLGLVMFGGAVFPVPYAFSLTGVAFGLFVLAFAAALNDYTCTLLIRASRRCHALGHRAPNGATLSFEELARVSLGESALAASRVALVVLLFGTNCGGLAVVAETAGRMACGLGLITGGVEGAPRTDPPGPSSGGGDGEAPPPGASPACAPLAGWLSGLGVDPLPVSIGDGGVVAMAVLSVLVLYPLCLARDISSLERAGILGLVLLLTLISILLSQAVAAGIPAAFDDPHGPSGFFWGHPTVGSVQAFPVFGYALYTHPVLLPMLTELTKSEKSKQRREGGMNARRRRRQRRSVANDAILEAEAEGVTSPLLDPAGSFSSIASVNSGSGGSDDVFHESFQEWEDDVGNGDDDDEGDDDTEEAQYDGEDEEHAVDDLGTPRHVGMCAAMDHAATVLELAVHLTMTIAVIAYAVIGLAGYALFGNDTRDNVLLNLNSPWLDGAMTLYQCLCFPPTFHSLRYTLDEMLDGAGAARPTLATHVGRVSVMLVATMAVTAWLPHSELLFAITGAIGVCAVCYILPVGMNLCLLERPGRGGWFVWRRGRWGRFPAAGVREEDGDEGALLKYALPAAALFAGTFLSAVGLYATLRGDSEP